MARAAAGKGNAMISLNQLTKHYGTQVAVENLSLEIPDGQIVGFLGPNGAGKSTTLKMLTGMIEPTSGSATVAGITEAGVVGPLVESSGVDPNLMVLAVGAGSLMFSHVNDSGFWMFKEYFGLSLRDTFRSWTMMETLVGVFGLLFVMLLSLFVTQG